MRSSRRSRRPAAPQGRGILDSIRARIDSLTPREREVMAMVTAGLLNKQIAGELNLSEITVKMHRRHMMEKMQAGSLAELVKDVRAGQGAFVAGDAGIDETRCSALNPYIVLIFRASDYTKA